MDPKTNSPPGLHLPEPSLTQQAVPLAPPAPEVQAVIDPPQQVVEAPAPAIQHYQPPVQPLVPATTPEAITQPVAPIDVSAVPQATVQEGEADGKDEQWTTKARDIATQYRTDPYMQSRALSQLKAEYLSARHSKTIKTDNAS
jgi:alpha-beta hydrolase superfamily lysophospholipase